MLTLILLIVANQSTPILLCFVTTVVSNVPIQLFQVPKLFFFSIYDFIALMAAGLAGCV